MTTPGASRDAAVLGQISLRSLPHQQVALPSPSRGMRVRVMSSWCHDDAITTPSGVISHSASAHISRWTWGQGGSGSSGSSSMRTGARAYASGSAGPACRSSSGPAKDTAGMVDTVGMGDMTETAGTAGIVGRAAEAGTTGAPAAAVGPWGWPTLLPRTRLSRSLCDSMCFMSQPRRRYFFPHFSQETLSSEKEKAPINKAELSRLNKLLSRRQGEG